MTYSFHFPIRKTCYILITFSDKETLLHIPLHFLIRKTCYKFLTLSDKEITVLSNQDSTVSHSLHFPIRKHYHTFLTLSDKEVTVTLSAHFPIRNTFVLGHEYYKYDKEDYQHSKYFYHKPPVVSHRLEVF